MILLRSEDDGLYPMDDSNGWLGTHAFAHLKQRIWGITSILAGLSRRLIDDRKR